MTVQYLADTSAVIRMLRGGAAPEWAELRDSGAIGICDPVELELLRGSPAGPRRWGVRRELRDTYPWCFVPDNVWDRALELQDRLAETSQHAGASVVDLVVAVTAAHHRLTVLHDDGDYRAIARVTGVPEQRVTEW